MAHIKFTTFGLIFAAFAYGTYQRLYNRLPDAGLTTEEQVRKYDYPFENHFVTTDDGYILRAHRIPHGKYPPHSNKQPVLLMPGILRSSEIWVSFGPARSLGFILADAGFDVWLGNYRGTTWSRRHILLDADQDVKQFWNYSLDELGYYDCPAFIDYILETTGQSKIIYIGETVGASMFFIMASEKATYLQKVKLMIAMAPMVDLGKAESPLYFMIEKLKNELQMFADHFGIYELFKHSRWLVSFGISVCGDTVLRSLCEIIHSVGVGFNSPQLNKTAIPLLLNGFPAGSSLKQLIHLSQIYKTGFFAKYNYGKKENLKKYGQSKPPVYHLENITTPISLYYGENDALVEKQGVERLAALLNNVISKTYMRGFNNGDFLWANDVVKLIYEDMVQLLKSW